MEKYRIAFTVKDFYYNPYYGIKERMLKVIPEEFKQNGYNIKFKCIQYPLDRYYRVHMSVRMTEEEIKKVFEEYKYMVFGLNNISYKLIIKHF